METNPELVNSLSRTLFILGRFPQRSQTFIQREFIEMRRRGLPVNLFAETEVKRADLKGELKEIYYETLFRGPYGRWIPHALVRGAIHPLTFASTLEWAITLPHRTTRQRARFITALLTAMDLIPKVRKLGYGYFHAHFAGYQTEIAMCLSRLTGLPYGATWHAYGIFKDRNILREKILGARSILTCTDYNLEHLREIAPEARDRIHLVYHGIDLARVPKVQSAETQKIPTWLAVGRLTPKKGFEHLVNAAAIMRDRGLKFELKIVGSGELESRLRVQISELSLDNRVRLLGETPNERVFELMGESTGLVVPSVRDETGNIDGIPNVILEAMAMTKPVIGSDLSGIPEAIKNGETGLLLPSGDECALADAMEKLSGDPELAHTLAKGGRRLLEKQFHLTCNVDRQIELLTGSHELNHSPVNAG